MDETTYRDPRVIKLLTQSFIAVQSDQDARPDLSHRYEDYGWPATILFDSEGHELAKLSGYIEPDRLVSVLEAFIQDPTPGPSAEGREVGVAPSNPFMTPAARQKVQESFQGQVDASDGAFKRAHKILPRNLAEWELGQASKVPRLKELAETVLVRQRDLLDPAWGGMYQYSGEGDWKHPHFEKLAQIQADNLYIYSLAYARLKKPAYLAAAESVDRYITQFLTSPERVFYASQDADLVPGQHAGDFFSLDAEGRTKHGIPRVDTHVYSQVNGELIQAELRFAPISRSFEKGVARAEETARWIIAHRLGSDGIFRHGEEASGGPYLGDTLSMAAACLDLYESTAKSEWLVRAEKSAQAIASRFAQRGAGFVSAVKQAGAVLNPLAQADENLALARFTNRLYQYTGKKITGKWRRRHFGSSCPRVTSKTPT